MGTVGTVKVAAVTQLDLDIQRRHAIQQLTMGGLQQVSHFAQVYLG